MSLPKLSGFKMPVMKPPLPKAAQVYVVGGAVRDELLGRPFSDRDWVVVGATVDDMLASGFTPVGADFPVFLHPVTKEEYALARTERKSGHGYKGFVFHTSPDVSLEEDLRRRDFTINAMAMAADGGLTDPYGGLSDLQTGTLRHVSEAFREDPLRVLRLARFMSRFVGFAAHQDTVNECQAMVSSGETSHLVAERVFAELNRGMAETEPSRMWSFLAEVDLTGHLSVAVPFAWIDLKENAMQALDGLEGADCRWVYWLCCCASVDEIQALAADLKLPNELRDFAVVAKRVSLFMIDAQPPTVPSWQELLAQVDVYRKPERLATVLGYLASFESAGLVLGSAQVLAVLDRCVNAVLTGSFKAAQRAYLAEHSQEHPAQAVQAFKQQWVSQQLTQNG